MKKMLLLRFYESATGDSAVVFEKRRRCGSNSGQAWRGLPSRAALSTSSARRPSCAVIRH